jgi:hypothetical protein
MLLSEFSFIISLSYEMKFNLSEYICCMCILHAKFIVQATYDKRTFLFKFIFSQS